MCPPFLIQLSTTKGLVLHFFLVLKWIGPATTLHQPGLLNYRGIRRRLTLNLTETHANIGENISIPAPILFINHSIRLIHPDGSVDDADELEELAERHIFGECAGCAAVRLVVAVLAVVVLAILVRRRDNVDRPLLVRVVVVVVAAAAAVVVVVVVVVVVAVAVVVSLLPCNFYSTRLGGMREATA